MKHIIALMLFTTPFAVLGSHLDAFKDCHKDTQDFDSCVMGALNRLLPYFKTGIPEWNLPALDPFFISRIKRIYGSLINIGIEFNNISEAGWADSSIHDFESDLRHNSISYLQNFPKKYVSGTLEISLRIFNKPIVALFSPWTLEMYDFYQTIRVVREPRISSNGTRVYDTPLKVTLGIKTAKDVKIRVSYLMFGGRKTKEFSRYLFEKIINIAWPAEFVLLKSKFDEVSSSALTDVLSKAFAKFPFNKLFP